jgi:hypothetical protein
VKKLEIFTGTKYDMGAKVMTMIDKMIEVKSRSLNLTQEWIQLK